MKSNPSKPLFISESFHTLSDPVQDHHVTSPVHPVLHGDAAGLAPVSELAELWRCVRRSEPPAVRKLLKVRRRVRCVGVLPKSGAVY